MNPEFRAWAKSYGGSFEPIADNSIVHFQTEHVLKLFEYELDFIKGQFTGKSISGVNIVAGFFLNQGMSSRTTSINGFDLIGVDVGLITTLHGIFSQISTVSTLLNTYDENLGLERVKKSPSDPDNFIGFGLLEGFHYNDMRNIIELTSIAIRYIMHHELAHLWNGHLAWTDHVHRSSDIDDNEVSNIHKALEYDADNRASTAILTLSPFYLNKFGNPMLNGQKMRLFSTYSPQFEGIITVETTIHRHICCIYIAMRIQSLKNGVFFEGRNHPAMSDRIIWLINNYFMIFGKGTNLSPYKVGSIIFDAVKYCEKAISTIAGSEYFDVFDKNNIDRAVKSLDAAKRTWDKNRSIFENFKRGITLPYYGTDTDGYDEYSKTLDITQFVSLGDSDAKSLPQFDVDASYYTQRIVNNSRFCMPFVKLKSANFELEVLNNILQNFGEVYYALNNFEETNYPDIWIEFLSIVKDFEEFISENLIEFEEWMDAWVGISLFDKLINYIVACSRLNPDQQVVLIEKRPLPVSAALKERLKYSDVIRIGEEFWPKEIYCFKAIPNNNINYAPGTNFTVKFDKNIGLVRVGIKVAMSYFIIRGEQAKLFHIDAIIPESSLEI